MFEDLRNYRTDCDAPKVFYFGKIAVIITIGKIIPSPNAWIDHNIEQLSNNTQEKWQTSAAMRPSTPAALPHLASFIIFSITAISEVHSGENEPIYILEILGFIYKIRLGEQTLSK